MKPSTITALLALWERCPECRPDTLFVAGDSNGGAKVICVVIASDGRKVLIPDYSPQAISALASDAIERWLLARSSAVVVGYRDAWLGWHCDTAHGDPAQWLDREGLVFSKSKLLALIASANAVADREAE